MNYETARDVIVGALVAGGWSVDRAEGFVDGFLAMHECEPVRYELTDKGRELLGGGECEFVGETNGLWSVEANPAEDAK